LKPQIDRPLDLRIWSCTVRKGTLDLDNFRLELTVSRHSYSTQTDPWEDMLGCVRDNI